MSIENHPADSRVNIDESGKVQTLTSRMGTGGGNVPMIMQPVVYDGANVTSPINASNPQPGDPCHTLSTDARNYVVGLIAMATQQGGAEISTNGICPTITAAAGMSGNNQPVIVKPIPIHDMATRFSGKRGDKQDGKGNGLGVGAPGDPMYTLTSGDRHAVVCGVDCRNATEYPELNGTIQAKSNGGFSLNCNQVVRVHYIVRRLTPTECARLQGFTDRWGDIEPKINLTDEEYAFWLEVRNTHAAINGKKVQDYTKKQMLTWYNKLQTDSAEYKMWGNGIALPPAVYCMQGMVDALKAEEDEAWML